MRGKKFKIPRTMAAILCTGILLFSCDLPLGMRGLKGPEPAGGGESPGGRGPQGPGNTGTPETEIMKDGYGLLTVALPGGRSTAGTARSVLPNSMIGGLKYRLKFTGPGETVVEAEAAGGTCTVGLTAGDWTVEAKAYKEMGDGLPDELVGSGTASAAVAAGQPVRVTLMMYVDPLYEAALTDIFIHNEAELRRIGTDFPIDDAAYYFRLENDITITGPWTPLGDSTTPFNATFLGDGHTISMNGGFSSAALASDGIGFFGYTGEDAYISDMTLAYPAAGGMIACTGTGTVYAGGLAGRVFNSDIYNIAVTGSLDFSLSSGGSLYAGGVAGSLGGTGGGPDISRCSFTGELNASADGTVIAGGVIGDSNAGVLQKSYAAGTILADSSAAVGEAHAGGVVGLSRIYIADCYAYTFSHAKSNGSGGYSWAGGIAGNAQGVRILNCYAAGAVKAEGPGSLYAGGVAGNQSSNNPFEGCMVLLNGLDGGSSTDVRILYADPALGGSTSNTGNKVWDAVSIIRGGVTYNNGTGTPLGSYPANNQDILPFNPAPAAGFKGQANEAVYTGANWDFGSIAPAWAWIGGYDFPVLGWQEAAPDLSHVLPVIEITWP